MTTYTDIPNSSVDQDSPITTTLMTALRNNPLAIAEGTDDAPVNQAVWHPYNMVTVNDGNTGLLWDQTVDGNASTIELPTFDDMYEYGFIFEEINITTSSVNLRVTARRVGTATYDVGVSVGSTLTTSNHYSGGCYIQTPHISSRILSVGTLRQLVAANDTVAGSSLDKSVGTGGSADTYDGARLSLTSGQFDEGRVYGVRRKCFLNM